MTDKTQPEALRLADEIHRWNNPCAKAAAELRRQHARIAELEAELEALENHDGNYKLSKSAGAVVDAAITAARARLGEKT